MNKNNITVPNVTIVIPNYNGMKFLKPCLDSLRNQTYRDFQILVVDNGSTDGSLQLVKEYQEVILLSLGENTGFCKAVNEGIKASKSPYVLLLNNDTVATEAFVGTLVSSISTKKNAFSVAGKMLKLYDTTQIDDAGNFYCALGWAFARGKDQSAKKFVKSDRIFSSCAGAALYKRKIFQEIGYFDEVHFAYLEDLDVGYRSRIAGYTNYYEPKAQVYHAGSGTSGTRYNEFKITFSARNNIYVIYKNMPILQKILNLPFILLGIFVKILFFAKRGYHKEYIKGIKEGLGLCKRNKEKKVKFRFKKLPNYFRIQMELWVNILRKAFDF